MEKVRSVVRRKAVFVGEAESGKTSLLIRAVRGDFFTHVPDVFIPAVADVSLHPHTVELELVDTSGKDSENRRAGAYTGADVVLVCFALDSPDALTRLISFWLPEIRSYCRGVPLVLIGCKSDSRARVVSREEGQAAGEKMAAVAYVECSAKDNRNTERVLKAAARAAFSKKRETIDFCPLL